MKPLIMLLALLALFFSEGATAQPIKTQVDDDLPVVAASYNDFAIDFFHQLAAKQPGNLFFSPISISGSMAMAYAGATGDTAVEMARTMHFMLDQNRLHPAVKALMASLKRDGTANNGILAIADSLWLQQGLPLLPSYTGLMQADYSAGLNEVDFKADPEAARLTINNWAAQNTADKITDLLPEGIVNESSRLILTDAVYFKNRWANIFNKSSTQEDNFYQQPGQSKLVRFMQQKGTVYSYYKGSDFQVISLPYVSSNLSMMIFLPDHSDGLINFEKALNSELISKSLKNMTSYSVDLKLPLFKFTKSADMNQTLKTMGMKLAFDDQKADFSGMTGMPQLYISNVIHKAYIDVDEEGSEAAAATAIIMDPLVKFEPAPLPPPHAVFIADHPFIFLIRDNKTNTILFMGRVTDPSQE